MLTKLRFFYKKNWDIISSVLSIFNEADLKTLAFCKNGMFGSRQGCNYTMVFSRELSWDLVYPHFGIDQAHSQ